MTNAEIIINQIISSAGQAVYRDEPIIFTASAISSLPEKYREMKKIGQSDARLLSNEARLFVEQAKFMEDYEDSFEYSGEFSRYFPTYRKMNDRQLRAYFSWRSGVRRGEVRETSLSFAFVYIYELINLVGAASAKEAIEKLDAFVDVYSAFDKTVKRYAERWRRDMAILHGVPEALTDGRVARDSFSLAAKTLSAPDAAGDEELYAAFAALSSANPEKTKLARRHREEAKALFCRIFRAYSAFCREKRKIPLEERLFGKVSTRPYVLFPSAVFYDPAKHEDYEFAAPDGKVYRRRGGAWTVTGLPEIAKKSAPLGALIKTVEGLIRPHFGMEGDSDATTVLKAIAENEIASYKAEHRTTPEIKFDFSKLGEIRDAADATAERLTVGEEEEEELIPAAKETDGTLDKVEKKILSLLIEGGDAEGFAKSRGKMLSVAVDAINEKLFPEFLDTVIEYDGESPVPVGDYVEDLKGYIL